MVNFFHVDLLNNVHTVRLRTTKFGGITRARDVFPFLGVSDALPQGCMAEALPNFGVHFYVCKHPLMHNYLI